MIKKGVSNWKRFFLYLFKMNGHHSCGGMRMREEEKKPSPWEAGDPKLPVVQSGHFENRRAYRK